MLILISVRPIAYYSVAPPHHIPPTVRLPLALSTASAPVVPGRVLNQQRRATGVSNPEIPGLSRCQSWDFGIIKF